MLLLTLFVFVLSFMTACVAMMFQYFMMPNMIAFPWAVLLMRISQKGEIWRHLMRPLGRCRFCNGIWITMYAYMYFRKLEAIMVLAMGLNFFFIWILSRYVIMEVDPNERVEEIFKVEWKVKHTPYQAMLKSYAIIGAGYIIMYGIIPLLTR